MTSANKRPPRRTSPSLISSSECICNRRKIRERGSWFDKKILTKHLKLLSPFKNAERWRFSLLRGPTGNESRIGVIHVTSLQKSLPFVWQRTEQQLCFVLLAAYKEKSTGLGFETVVLILTNVYTIEEWYPQSISSINCQCPFPFYFCILSCPRICYSSGLLSAFDRISRFANVSQSKILDMLAYSPPTPNPQPPLLNHWGGSAKLISSLR